MSTEKRDIVTRLREYPADEAWDALMAEAADEITRLRRDTDELIDAGCELGTDLAELRSKLAKAREALEVAEYSERWTDDRGFSHSRCPVCACSHHQGHQPDCVVGAALAKLQEDPHA